VFNGFSNIISDCLYNGKIKGCNMIILKKNSVIKEKSGQEVLVKGNFECKIVKEDNSICTIELLGEQYLTSYRNIIWYHNEKEWNEGVIKVGVPVRREV
jgi:hypothetical protein